mgnify:FL=1
MQRILSSYVFSNRKLTPALLAEVEGAGIGAVELFCLRTHFDYHEAQELRELAGWLKDRSFRVHALHSPTERDSGSNRQSGIPLSISDLERSRRLEAVDEIKRALDVAEYFPFSYLVQHVCSSRDEADPRRWDAAFNSLEHLALFARQRGVTIAIENTPGEMATPHNLRQFLTETRLGNIKFCFDTGHAHLGEGVAAGWEIMRDIVVTTHLHDNRGERDEHLLPFEGTIDWKAALRALGRELPLVLELKAEAVPDHSLEKIIGAFEKLEKATVGTGHAARASSSTER